MKINIMCKAIISNINTNLKNYSKKNIIVNGDDFKTTEPVSDIP